MSNINQERLECYISVSFDPLLSSDDRRERYQTIHSDMDQKLSTLFQCTSYPATLLTTLSQAARVTDLKVDTTNEFMNSTYTATLHLFSLDDIIGGGLLPGTITEVVGTSASGKTQLCLQAAAAAALDMRASVAFIDTSNSFSGHRLAQIVTGLHGKDRFAEHKAELRSVSRRVLCFKAFDIYAAMRLLDELLEHLDEAKTTEGGSNQEDFFHKLRLLVLDSASAIISPVLGGAHSQGHALMASLSGLLRRIAREHDVAVLLTNHTVTGEAGRPKPALGESWKAVPSVRILLTREDESDLCTATVTKMTTEACGRTVPYVVSRDGLRAVRFEQGGDGGEDLQ